MIAAAVSIADLLDNRAMAVMRFFVPAALEVGDVPRGSPNQPRNGLLRHACQRPRNAERYRTCPRSYSLSKSRETARVLNRASIKLRGLFVMKLRRSLLLSGDGCRSRLRDRYGLSKNARFPTAEAKLMKRGDGNQDEHVFAVNFLNYRAGCPSADTV